MSKIITPIELIDWQCEERHGQQYPSAPRRCCNATCSSHVFVQVNPKTAQSERDKIKRINKTHRDERFDR